MVVLCGDNSSEPDRLFRHMVSDFISSKDQEAHIVELTGNGNDHGFVHVVEQEIDANLG